MIRNDCGGISICSYQMSKASLKDKIHRFQCLVFCCC